MCFTFGVIELGGWGAGKMIGAPLPPGCYGILWKHGFSQKNMLIYSPAVKSTVLICFSFPFLHKAHTEVERCVLQKDFIHS